MKSIPSREGKTIFNFLQKIIADYGNPVPQHLDHVSDKGFGLYKQLFNISRFPLSSILGIEARMLCNLQKFTIEELLF